MWREDDKGPGRRHQSLVGSTGALEPSGLIYTLTDQVTLVKQAPSSLCLSAHFSVAVHHIPAPQSAGKPHRARLVTVTISVAAVLGQPHCPSVNKPKDSLSSFRETHRQEAFQGQCLWGNASSKDSSPPSKGTLHSRGGRYPESWIAKACLPRL